VGGPLDRLLVIDHTWGLPGSIAGMMFADYGARVVKLERPGSDAGPPPALRAVVERGKWSITLDPANPADAEVFEGLLARADVLLTSAPQAPSGPLATEVIRGRHPHLVHGHISGYGLDGPFLGRPAYDPLVAARVGLMTEQAGHREGPIFLGHPSIDYVTAFLAAIGTLSALRARRVTGQGQFVDTSMLDGALAVSAMNWWYNEKDLS
jgi:crotonobetainyl-CoA:carnitine CoA-transferase CaiB-like acyl-CoA transferase